MEAGTEQVVEEHKELVDEKSSKSQPPLLVPKISALVQSPPAAVQGNPKLLESITQTMTDVAAISQQNLP